MKGAVELRVNIVAVSYDKHVASVVSSSSLFFFLIINFHHVLRYSCYVISVFLIRHIIGCLYLLQFGWY